MYQNINYELIVHAVIFYIELLVNQFNPYLCSVTIHVLSIGH